MSSELTNAHIAMGEPCGEDADMEQVSAWAGRLILGGNGGLNTGQMSALRDIGEYLHGDATSEAARSWALERYYQLFDSITGRGE